jgi:hypothetical protein
MSTTRMRSVEIPQQWTARQALDTWEFLIDVTQAIGEAYEDQMVPLISEEQRAPELPFDDGENPSPFDD